MRFIVYGAGAVGGVVGGRLHQHGHDVVLIARGAHYEAIRAHGLALATRGGERVMLTVPVVEHPDAIEFEDGDVVMLAMKSQDTEAAVRALRASTSRQLPIVCLQNGVANEPAALRYFESVYTVLITMPCGYLEPGLVEAYVAPITGVLDLGRFPDGVDSTAEEIAAALGRSTFVSETRTAIMPWKFRKLLQNLANGIGALCGLDADTADLISALHREAEGVLDAAHIACTPAPEFAARQSLIDMTSLPPSTGSTWQSLYRGTTVETDYMTGEIVLIARLHGLSAPLNAAAARVVNDAARAGIRPASLSVEELRERLAAAM